MKGILVVDVGTSKVHSNIFSAETGELLSSYAISYHRLPSEEGHVELSSEEIWEAAQEAAERTVKNLGSAEVAALTFSWFGAELMTLDADGEEVFPLIVSFDDRAAEEAAEIIRKTDAEERKCIVRGGITPASNPAKVLWLLRHAPERFGNVAEIATIQQFFFQKMGLPRLAERSMRQTLQFHRQDGTFLSEVGAVCGIGEERFSDPAVWGAEIVGTTACFGRVTFSKEIPVLAGGHDCILSQLGSGVDPAGNDILGEVCGTYDLMGFLLPEECPEEEKECRALPVREREECRELPARKREEYRDLPVRDTHECLNTPIRGTLAYLYGHPSGERLEAAVMSLWGQCSSALLSELYGKSVLDGSHGGLWAEPDWEAIRRSPASLQRFGEQRVFESLVEETAFELRECYETLCEKHGRPFRLVRAGGGGTKSKQAVQIRADVYGVPFEIPDNEEVSSLGAAILASVALGVHPDYRTAIEKMVHVRERFEPRSSSVFQDFYKAWKKIIY